MGGKIRGVIIFLLRIITTRTTYSRIPIAIKIRTTICLPLTTKIRTTCSQTTITIRTISSALEIRTL